MDELLSRAELRIVARLVLAWALGLVLGIDRERQDKPAGLRTHILVCTSCAALMVGARLVSDAAPSATVGDSGRVAQGILSGIGFIGAGTIVRQGNLVTGITTAATIFLAASVGILVGSGYLLLGTTVTLLALLTLNGLGWLEQRLGTNSTSEPDANRQHDDS